MSTALHPSYRYEQLSRQERSVRTARLLESARTCAEPQERDALLKQVIELNLRVARAVASRYRDRGVEPEDLDQVAYEGLTKAVHRFDPTQHSDFLSYAVPTIRGELQRHFRDRGWMVRPTRRIQELQRHIAAVESQLTPELNHEPTPDQVCRHLQIARQDYDEARRAFGCFAPTSLDQPLSGQSGATIGDLVASDQDGYSAAEARVLIASLLQQLTARERYILYLRYTEDQTQREIGARFGVAQMQVSRWLTRILEDLRAILDTAALESASNCVD